MSAAAGDTTQDWLLPEQARPPLIGELERRIDEALAIARSSEAAVATVGAAALDAAAQARHAAELAERASAAAVAAVQERPRARRREAEASAPTGTDLGDFHARADYVAARLKELQRVPLAQKRDVESRR